MDTIRTYAIGNGEITLTDLDTEELRKILQTEYLRKIITEVIAEHNEAFAHLTSSQLRYVIDEMIRINSDYIDYDSSYFAENILENALDITEDFFGNK